MDTGRLPVGSIHQRSPGGPDRDDDDDFQARQGRVRHLGVLVQQPNGPIQPPPMFFTHDHHVLPLVDHFKGRSAFLLAGGPSLVAGQDVDFICRVRGIGRAQTDAERSDIRARSEELAAQPRLYELSAFSQPGIFSIGVNNVCRVVRPNGWVAVDSPSNFIISNWLDSRVMKFAPICHTQKVLFDNADRWALTDVRTMDCPNVVYYKRNEKFQPEQFLEEDTINWGCHRDYGGGRSVLFAAIRICYLLGFRRIFFVGVDLTMDQKNHYAFAQNRAPGSVAGNNSTYKMMNHRFDQLRPIFDRKGFHLFNCNPQSGLRSFPTIPFDEAVRLVQTEEMRGIDYQNERTEGMYDREAEQKKEKERRIERRAARHKQRQWTDEQRREVKQRLDQLRARLSEAKELAEAHRMTAAAEPDAAWKAEQDVLDQAAADTRAIFRQCEDEKRIKWGEEPKWGLWPIVPGAPKA